MGRTKQGCSGSAKKEHFRKSPYWGGTLSIGDVREKKEGRKSENINRTKAEKWSSTRRRGREKSPEGEDGTYQGDQVEIAKRAWRKTARHKCYIFRGRNFSGGGG